MGVVLTRMSGTLELFMGKGKPFGNSFNITGWSGGRFSKPYMFTTLSRKSHAESKRLLASLYSQSYSQSSPELKETSRVIVSGRMRNQLHTWAPKHATVNFLEKNEACTVGLTSCTAWLYGLGNGKDSQANGTTAEQALGVYIQGSAGFFWRSEFDTLHS